MSDSFRSRRAFLRTTSATALAAAAVGPGEVGADGEASEGETITVGPDGEFAFDPETLRIDPGTTVRWVWDSDNHNVVASNAPDGSGWSGHEEISDAGTEHTHTFEVEGTYEYLCEPHAGAGMQGEIVVGEGTDSTTDDRSEDGEPGSVHPIVVGPGGEHVFDPGEVTIAPGDTVRWVWESDNHNVAPQSQPDEANWEGHPEISNAGVEYEHTFSVEGTYEYVCEPHAAHGMEGTIVVGDPDSGTDGASGGGEDAGDGADSNAQNGAENGSGANESDETESNTNGDDDNESDTNGDDEVPGPGVAGALAGLGATAGVLARETESAD